MVGPTVRFLESGRRSSKNSRFLTSSLHSTDSFLPNTSPHKCTHLCWEPTRDHYLRLSFFKAWGPLRSIVVVGRLQCSQIASSWNSFTFENEEAIRPYSPNHHARSALLTPRSWTAAFHHHLQFPTRRQDSYLTFKHVLKRV